jgi:hypothetical protein
MRLLQVETLEVMKVVPKRKVMIKAKRFQKDTTIHA